MKDKQNTDKAKTHRVFFALWPDDRMRELITGTFQHSSYANLAKGHRYRPSNLHMTLHFLGNISAKQLTCIEQQAESIKLGSFNLNINQYGHFKRAGVLWLGPSYVPDELLLLYHQLGKALSACAYKTDKGDYHPHITLMRKFHHKLDEIEINPIEWSVSRFALIESVSVEEGVAYHPVRFYNLD